MAAALLFVVVVAIGWLRGIPFAEIVLIGISQMVSLVPEGLPVAMTIALAVGVQRMAKRGAIICTDKTGTLTRNEMTVVAVYLPAGRRLEVTGAGYEPTGA